MGQFDKPNGSWSQRVSGIEYSKAFGTIAAIYFLFQKVDVAANTMAAVAKECVPLVTAGLQICLKFDRLGVRGRKFTCKHEQSEWEAVTIAHIPPSSTILLRWSPNWRVPGQAVRVVVWLELESLSDKAH